jgi:hypothetical protein
MATPSRADQIGSLLSLPEWLQVRMAHKAVGKQTYSCHIEHETFSLPSLYWPRNDLDSRSCSCP